MRRILNPPFLQSLWAAMMILPFSGAQQLKALDLSVLMRTDPSHYTEKRLDGTVVNWTGGFIVSEATARLPEIDPAPEQWNRKTGSYGGGANEEPARSITEARFLAREKARRIATENILKSLQNLPLNSSFTVYEKMSVDEGFKERMGRIYELIRLKRIRPGRGEMTVELALPLLGQNGVFTLIANAQYGGLEIPEMDVSGLEDPITGIIVDLRELDHFETSLEPAIFTDQGRKIYGPEFIDPAATTGRGPVAFHSSVRMAKNDDRVGLHPYYLFASGSRGKYKSDVFIDSEDARRILSSRSGRKALKNGAVVFIR